MEILKIKNLSFTYPGAEYKALDNISLDIKSGDFVVVCGETGCGKSTFLRMLKRELTPAGQLSGEIYYKGKNTEELSDREATGEIGFVMQKPESQIVTDKVWHELAFGLENMGLPTPVIRRRVSEISSYFGIGNWFDKSTVELSGGQKQILNLASVMVMQPKILILDEPTSQLDPIAAADFIATLQKLNRELNLTIILVEHRLEEVFPIADKVILMGKGKVLCYDTPYNTGIRMKEYKEMLLAMPCAMRIYSAFDIDKKCPVTVKEGRRFIEENFGDKIKSLDKKPYKNNKNPVLEFNDVYFRYEKNSKDILRGTSFKVYENEIFCILGDNGSGKTTALNAAAGLLTPYSGSIKVFGKKINGYKKSELYKNNLALLPQDPQTVFLKESVKEDLGEISEDISLPFDLSPLYSKHPYDLSGGEQQLCALAKILMQKPKLLLLDEPTKGIDAYTKHRIIDILSRLKGEGMTVVIVTHDVEFAALCADRCALFFGGEVISSDTPEQFFSENNFYTTAANRMTRYKYDRIITAEDAIEICKLNLAESLNKMIV